MNPTLLALAIRIALQEMRAPRHFRLSGDDDSTRRVISNAVALAEGQRRSWVTVTRVGSFTDPRYGRFEITPKMLADMVRNFEAGVVGTDIFIDVDHKPGDGAAARVLALKVDAGRLRAQVEWTEHGVEAVRRKGFTYLSAEFHEDWHDNEKGESHGCVLLGAGLTIRPVIKRLEPVTLAVDGSESSGPVFVHPGLVRQLTESLEQTAMNRFKKLLARLEARGITLSAAQIETLRAAFESAAKALAEDADDKAETALFDQFEPVAKALASAGDGATIQLSMQAAPPADDDAIGKAVAKALAERESESKKAKDKVEAVRKAYNDAIDDAKALSEGTREQLKAGADVIGEGWTEDQAKAYAQRQVTLGEQLEASRQLSEMGYRPAGVVHLSVDDSNELKSLAEEVRKGLKSSSVGDQLKLPEEEKLTPFQKRVLAQFDAANAPKLRAEAKKLAGGPVDTGDLSLPASYQRAVLLESLADNRILDLVSTSVDPTQGPVHTVKYEQRDTSALVNDGVVYEGHEIPPGGVRIQDDFAYIVPMKISLDLTNEAIFFSRNSRLMDYDAWGRTLISNAQVMRENVGRRIANYMQRESAAYGAVQEADVAFTQSTANPGTYRAAAGKFPIVRPHQVRDLRGNAVGDVRNPMTVTVGGANVPAFDGTGNQPAGNYFRVVNWNLGLVQIVNQAGVPQAGLTVTASYSRETNLVLFDLDAADGVEKEKHLNGLIRAIGSRKAVMSQDRYVNPNFALMAATLNDTASNADVFTAAAARADSGISSQGDLLPIKGIPSWSTNAPNLDLGEERIQIGQRGALSYTIAKPFSVGTPFEAVGPNGLPTGRKVAYGEEYSSIHVPGPYRGRFTAVVAYSKSAREA